MNYTTYDALGRMTGGNQVIDGQTYSMSYSYNLAGSRTSMTYPSGRVITSEYDEAGRMAGVRDQQSGVYYAGVTSTDATNRLQYAAHCAVSLMKLGNGLWEHASYNNRLQPTQIGLGTSGTDSSVHVPSYRQGRHRSWLKLLMDSFLGSSPTCQKTCVYSERRESPGW